MSVNSLRVTVICFTQISGRNLLMYHNFSNLSNTFFTLFKVSSIGLVDYSRTSYELLRIQQETLLITLLACS